LNFRTLAELLEYVYVHTAVERKAFDLRARLLQVLQKIELLKTIYGNVLLDLADT